MIEIKFEELSAGLKKGTLVLIDVRSPGELQSEGKIPGSFNIPSPDVKTAFSLSDAEFKKKYGFDKMNPNLVFSCKSGARAQGAMDAIKSIIPAQNMKLYSGSFSDWKQKGGAITK